MNTNKLLVNPLLYHVVNDLEYLTLLRSMIARHYEVNACDVANVTIESTVEVYERYFQFKVRGFTCGMIISYSDNTIWYTPITHAMAYSHYHTWFCTYIDERAEKKGIALFKTQR